MDEVTVHVEAPPKFADPEVLDEEARALVARIKHSIGLTTRVVVEASGAIERSLGKARRVVDRRPRE